MKFKYFAVLFCSFLPTLVNATQVNAVRMWSSPEGTRMVFDVDRKVEHNVFVLKDPDRVVIDLQHTVFASPITDLDYRESLVKGIRTGSQDNNNLRVVLDVKSNVTPKSFLLNPTNQYGYRLVVDLEPVNGHAATPAASPANTAPAYGSAIPQQSRDIVVAIDAGHGGEDPGAIGRGGAREKEVALSIARKLEALLRQERGITPVMIRSGDYYVSLRGRIQKARQYKADLFISIHADAFTNEKAQGSSVYVLSQRGASSEAARWLAASENNSDLIGGVSLDDKDDLLASVLLDLSQNATLAASMDVGGRILEELKQSGQVHKSQVEHAGFVVLKAPDVPSILVETGFISNRQEESQLRSQRHQQRIASALLQGIKRYFNSNPPAGTLLASSGKRQHLVAEGDTLSSIARQYSISPHLLQSANGLSSDKIKAGHTLIIPVIGGS
ncbi:MAG: N-acetylmuramoyl-L-alanine amidase [Gammaproteobacteria bacterium]|nr:N-acetylmuramoyl-L-alanine amidase [Gammaproteobacteria bacterium]